ncbi:phosphoribosyl-AMP cyclohydrolase [Haloglomus halophilum]|uniref:phosphoribosyl-AMP cyclohydrolase n=1 Tax=Haloglomus halophilum TaxID=2962672 RepID=UPI0020C9B830|nr:phosphoribosyl-AMP cyclohydrolase [Haloglomus halophilum]
MSETESVATDLAVDLEFGDDGLVPAVAQDAESGAVLMLAYVDEEALAATRETGYAHYHSRSRDELWKKGGSSGHVQRVREVRVDCDGDALLYRVEQEGGACHTGFESCFYRTLDGEQVGERVFDPDSVYDESDGDGDDED